jgi:hypothetical protein
VSQSCICRIKRDSPIAQGSWIEGSWIEGSWIDIKYAVLGYFSLPMLPNKLKIHVLA